MRIMIMQIFKPQFVHVILQFWDWKLGCIKKTIRIIYLPKFGGFWSRNLLIELDHANFHTLISSFDDLILRLNIGLYRKPLEQYLFSSFGGFFFIEDPFDQIKHYRSNSRWKLTLCNFHASICTFWCSLTSLNEGFVQILIDIV